MRTCSKKTRFVRASRQKRYPSEKKTSHSDTHGPKNRKMLKCTHAYTSTRSKKSQPECVVFHMDKVKVMSRPKYLLIAPQFCHAGARISPLGRLFFCFHTKELLAYVRMWLVPDFLEFFSNRPKWREPPNLREIKLIGTLVGSLPGIVQYWPLV
jgi:hypothetical protein